MVIQKLFDPKHESFANLDAPLSLRLHKPCYMKTDLNIDFDLWSNPQKHEKTSNSSTLSLHILIFDSLWIHL